MQAASMSLRIWNRHGIPVSWEAVVEADPDIIVINDYGETTADEKIQSLKDNEALSDVTAIKNENFLVITFRKCLPAPA